MKKKTVTAILLTPIALLIVGLATCATFASRNTSFEEKMNAFVTKDEPGSEFRLLNGKDLSGWEVHGIGRWTVEEGVLTVKRGLGYLATRCDAFDDIILSLDIRVSEEGNSGVFFRSKDPGFGLRPWPEGYEAQVDNHDPQNPTGSIYDMVTAEPLLTKDNEWFEMEISAIGPHIEIRVNNETVAEATDTTHKKGFIALQAHDPFCQVDFREIVLRIPENTEALW